MPFQETHILRLLLAVFAVLPSAGMAANEPPPLAPPKVIEKHLDPARGVLLSSIESFGYPFVATETGRIARIRGHFEIRATIDPVVPLFVELHQDMSGGVGHMIGHSTAELAVQTEGDYALELSSPEVSVVAGTTYWLVAESPSGAEIQWLNQYPTQDSVRFVKNLLSGERRYEPAPRGAFEIEIEIEIETADPLTMVKAP